MVSASAAATGQPSANQTLTRFRMHGRLLCHRRAHTDEKKGQDAGIFKKKEVEKKCLAHESFHRFQLPSRDSAAVAALSDLFSCHFHTVDSL